MRLTKIKKADRLAGKRLRDVAAMLIQALEVPTITAEERKELAKGPTEGLWTGQHQSSQAFRAWLASFKVEAPFQVPPFAEGGDGRAYFVGQYVVKFTRDRAGANIANMCIGVPGAPAPVIAVWRVPALPLWAILQWRVHPEKVHKDIKMAADYLTAWLDMNPELEAFPDDQKEQELEARKLLKALRGPANLVSSAMLVMQVHNKLYYSTGFVHTDGGPTNISMKDDEVVYHDLGPNMPGDYNPRHVLDRVHATRKKLNLPEVDEI